MQQEEICAMVDSKSRIGSIVLSTDGGCSLRDSSYKIQPGEAKIEISARIPPGAFLTDEQIHSVHEKFGEFLQGLTNIQSNSAGFLQSIPRTDYEEILNLAENVVADVHVCTEEKMRDYDPEFCFWLLQLWAAEARYCQDRLTSSLDESNQIFLALNLTIRKLSGLSRRLLVGYVRGLRKSAKSDWARLANEARQNIKRLQLQATLPQDKAEVRQIKPKPTVKKIAENPLDLPKLKRLLSGKILLVVGGIPSHEKIQKISDWLGDEFDIEWPDIMGKTFTRLLGGITQSILNGGIACVLMLEGLMSHTSSEPIEQACRTKGVPYAYVGKAGKGSLLRELSNLESVL